MSQGQAGASPGRPAPADVPRAPPAPLIAPTGSPGLDAVTDVVNSTVAPFETAPPANEGAVGAVAQKVGAVVAAAGAPASIIDTAFAELTAPLAAMLPAMPALTLGAMHVGPPHAHTHPPSLVPPAPPVPLPSMGALVGAGAVTVLIGGMPAARAGDIGMAVTCGSLAPPFEVSTGSSKVFIGGARAARLGDITQHCNPASSSLVSEVMAAAGIAAGAVGGIVAGNTGAVAQAAADAGVMAIKALCGKDPGVPPGMGALIGPPVPTVLIGGFPCPPVGQMAVGGILKMLKKAAGALMKLSSRRGNGHCADGSHPIYLVTGENFDAFVDFVSGGLFEWRRHCSSARARSDGPLGHGWRHFWQRSLDVRLHRAVFTDWDGVQTEFPRFEFGSSVAVSEGYRLERLGRGLYRLAHGGQPTLEFAGSEFVGPLRVSKVIQGARELELFYDTLGRFDHALERDAVTEERRRYKLHYDAGGHLTHVVEWVGGFGAQPAERLVRAAYAYDASSNLVAAQDALAGRWAYEYDAFHRVTRQVDPRAYAYTFRYDAAGRCIEASGQDGLWACKVDYYPDQRLTRYTEGDSATWEVHYDADGFVTKIVDPYGGAKVRERDAQGRLAKEVDSGGREVRWLYDDDGMHHARVDAYGHVFPPEAEMPRVPNLFERELPSTAFGWMFAGAPAPSPRAIFGADKSTLVELPEAAEYAARLCLRLRTPTNGAPVAETLRIERDALGRKVRETDAFGRSRTWGYDRSGNIVTECDRDGRISTRVITSWNLLGEARDPLGAAMRYRYSSLEEIVGVTDPLGNDTVYIYDAKGRLVRIEREGMPRDTYVYDTGDHFLEKRDGSGSLVFTNEIHANHLVKTRRLTSGGHQVFNYDARGCITEASTERHKVHIAHDEWGRRTRDLRDEAGVEHEHRVDPRTGTLVTRSVTLSHFVSTRETKGNETRLVDPAGAVLRLVMADDGLVRFSWREGLGQLLQYDHEGRLTARLVYGGPSRAAAARPWATAFTYTAEGDLRAREDSGTGRTTYEYDAARRLTAVVDPRGERRDLRHDGASNLYRSWLEVGRGNRLVRSDTETFAYDDRARMRERVRFDGTVTRYGYDSLDRLVSVAVSGGDRQRGLTWEAFYDGLGRRTQVIANGQRRRFYWDGDRLAAEVFPGGALRLYMYATRESLVAVGFVDYDGETADPSTGRSFVVISDPNGLPVRIQAGDDVVWCAQQADPFGPLEVASHASVEYNLRWPGHYFDRETGLHDNRHRSYDPTLGRYLQPDPIGYAGSPVNLYAYCGSPLTQVDLLGLQCSHSEEEAQGHAPDGRENPPEQDASAAKPTREQLAASEGTSDEHVEARKSVARDFYAKHCPEMSENQIDSHVACIDTTKPVKVVRIPPDGAGPNGDQLNTWVAPGGRPGQYFTPDANAQPDQLGINSRCIAPAQDNQPPRICPREQQTFTADPNTPATGLQSTAAPADDTWSVPGGRYSPEQGDLPSSTGGGGTQVMVPRSQQTGFSESD